MVNFGQPEEGGGRQNIKIEFYTSNMFYKPNTLQSEYKMID